jgi:putative hydrolase of HD superfamily
MTNAWLKKQIAFIVEIDKLKHVARRTYLMDNSRHENSAEHSWHLAIMALLLSGYAAERKIDVFRVMQMVLIHDIVEIDAGDTFCYDEKGQKGRIAKEAKAAERLFGILPGDQAKGLRKLWDEFEARKTPEAKFAAALDRFQPLLHNYYTEGYAWKENGVTTDMVIERNRHISEGSPELWHFAEKLIMDAVEKGYLER